MYRCFTQPVERKIYPSTLPLECDSGAVVMVLTKENRAASWTPVYVSWLSLLAHRSQHLPGEDICTFQKQTVDEKCSVCSIFKNPQSHLQFPCLAKIWLSGSVQKTKEHSIFFNYHSGTLEAAHNPCLHLHVGHCHIAWHQWGDMTPEYVLLINV